MCQTMTGNQTSAMKKWKIYDLMPAWEYNKLLGVILIVKLKQDKPEHLNIGAIADRIDPNSRQPHLEIRTKQGFGTSAASRGRI